MRWFLTDDARELAEALLASGQEVVSTPEGWASAFVRHAGFHPREYPLKDLVLASRADVAVLVDPIRAVPFSDGTAEFGYAEGYAKTLRNRRVTLAMWAHDDRGTLDALLGKRYRSCSCMHLSVAVHIVGSTDVGNMIRNQRRVAVWRPGEGAGKVVAAVEHAKAGQTYSPRRMGSAWG